MTDRAWVATRKGLLELRRHDAQWRIAGQSFLGEPVSMVLPPSADLGGRMLAALNLGHFGVKLQASDDQGQTWQELPAPVYPPQPANKAGPDWTLGLIWALEAAHGRLWAGTLPGGLFVSDDRGGSWSLNEALWQKPEREQWFGGGNDAPGLHSICPHPQRADELLVAVSCGGVWVSEDGGADWRLSCEGMRADYMPPELADDGATQDPHRIVRSPSSPEVLWCQHHGGQWRSTDGGASWQELTSAPLSRFGFAVAVHPQDANTAWFAPAVADQCRVPVGGRLVVNRTRDGGASFETLGQGLPAADCYDLVYRHGLAVADDGQTLLMGSTTGGLWASMDSGDHWQTVSTTLPPIYALRLG